jgi:hypothetical protein
LIDVLGNKKARQLFCLDRPLGLFAFWALPQLCTLLPEFSCDTQIEQADLGHLRSHGGRLSIFCSRANMLKIAPMVQAISDLFCMQLCIRAANGAVLINIL